MVGAGFLNLKRYEQVPKQDGLSKRLKELMRHNNFSQEVRIADALFLAFDDISPKVLAGQRDLPLISGAFEGIRYLANTRPERASDDVRALLAKRIIDLYEFSRQGLLYSVDAQIQRQIEFSSELEGFISSDDDTMQPFKPSIHQFQEAYARVSAGDRVVPELEPIQNALEVELERVQRKNAPLMQAQIVSREDRQLFAAAYAQSCAQPEMRDSEIVLINSSQGARWLYQKEIADQAIRELEGMPPRALSRLHIAHDLRKRPLPYNSKQREQTAA